METSARYLAVGAAVLAILAMGFGFVYWLDNADVGLRARALYRVRFQGPVSGLQVGAAVQFNGLRVGEVASLAIDKDDPEGLTATIDVDAATPVRAGAKVGVAYQGLMGTPAIALEGGAGSAPLASHGEPAVLVAGPDVGLDLQSAARRMLGRLDQLIADNADGVKHTVANLADVTGALARNSGRIDAIMVGLERLSGGGPPEKPKPVYDLATPPPIVAATPVSKTQISVAMPTALIALQSQHMLARVADGQISQLGDALWSDSLPNLVLAKATRVLDEAGFLAAAATSDPLPPGADQLVIEIRDFTVLGGADPVADIDFSAKLMDSTGHIVATRSLRASAPAKGVDAPQITAAFDAAFAKVATELVAWVGQSI
jgi:phospholipid/cholesterol/gamma-HCH transport system substrate-binding protein